MATERKEKLIRVLQILETTDKKTPINATSIVEKLENEYNVGKVDRRSIYRDIAMLQSCGYKIEQAKASLETAKKKLQQYIEARDNAQAEMEHYQQQENEYNVELSKSNVEQVKKANGIRTDSR